MTKVNLDENAISLVVGSDDTDVKAPVHTYVCM